MLHDVELLLPNYDTFLSFSEHMNLKVVFYMTNTHYYILYILNGFYFKYGNV